MTIQDDLLIEPERKGVGAAASRPEADFEQTVLLDENERLRRQLAEQSAIIARYEVAMGVFRTAASHDLISPIQNIFAFARLLQRKLDADDQRGREYLEFILRGADRMRLLVEALWDYSRHAPWQIDYQDVELNQTVDSAIAHLSDIIDEAGAIIECDDLPSLEGDAAMLELLFCCLIENAVKFRSEVQPILKIVDSSDRQYVRLTFVDNGIGIDLEFARTIFEPLKRLHGPMDRMGAGLGLSMCQEILRSHHGTISIAQSDEQGSTILVELPKSQELKTADRQSA